MVTVTREQYKQVEYLIEQSIRGNHLLFDPRDVKRVCRSDATRIQDTEATRKSLEKLISLPSISQMRRYLASLDRRSYEQTLIAFLNVVENNLYENSGTRH